jgi:hypothetical protein
MHPGFLRREITVFELQPGSLVCWFESDLNGAGPRWEQI